MAIAKKNIKPLSAVKGDFVTALQNAMDKGNLLLAVLETALQHGAVSGKVESMVRERVTEFREALYGKDE